MAHAKMMIGRPVPNEKTTGKTQFHEAGNVMAISTMVKKYISRCGQKAMAKKIPNMNAQNQLLLSSTVCNHRDMPWSCS